MIDILVLRQFQRVISCAGQVSQGNQHGDGCCVYPGDVKYSGQWINGIRHGQGKLSGSKGEFAGEWKEDVPSLGSMTNYTLYGSGTLYTGQVYQVTRLL